MKTACLPSLARRVHGSTKCVLLARGLGAENVLALRRMLEALHFPVVVAGTLKAAMAACRNNAPALLLTPTTEEGLRLLWLARRRMDKAVLRLAILTQPHVELTLQALAAGAQECLSLPCDMQLLAQRLRQMRAAMMDKERDVRLAAS